MTTIELTRELIKARKLQDGDNILARALNMRLVNSLGRQKLRGQLARDGKRKAVIVWRPAMQI
jgi:hypothetical protein